MFGQKIVKPESYKIEKDFFRKKANDSLERQWSMAWILSKRAREGINCQVNKERCVIKLAF